MFSFGIPTMHAPHTNRPQSNAMAAASFLFLTILAATTTTTYSIGNTSGISNGSCIPAERAALLSFKTGITGDPENRLVSWKQDAHDCCRWSGVTCSRRTGHVVKLDLRSGYNFPNSEYFLSSLDDPQDYSLRGKVSSSLLALRRLEYLDLSFNTLLGDAKAMPGFLGSLQSLTYLDLSNMGFRGRVPPQLGNLSKLAHLDIQSYSYIYSDDISWLTRLHSLEHLDMSWINLSGVVDWLHMVNAIPNLVVLSLLSCGLNKSNAPSSLVHHNLTLLEELHLSFNNFSGPAAPNWFWYVTSLRSLSLLDCQLSGTFPDELGNLTLLETFDIGGNNIQGMIPATLQNMCNLRSLVLTGNNIGADISEVIDRIPNYSWNNFQRLSLARANLTGTTLQFVSTLSSLNTLDVSFNLLSGSMPVEICAHTNMTYLDLGNNNLSGSVPVEIDMLTNLTHLDLGNIFAAFLNGGSISEARKMKKTVFDTISTSSILNVSI